MIFKLHEARRKEGLGVSLYGTYLCRELIVGRRRSEKLVV